jgi:hypothetical protein
MPDMLDVGLEITQRELEAKTPTSGGCRGQYARNYSGKSARS